MKQIPQHTLDFINSWLELTTKWQETAGLSIAIMHKGKLVFEKAYGQANVENSEKLTTEHTFRVASQSKVFTATAIMQLQEAGKLRIDDYVFNHLEWLKNHKDERWKDVTIRQLLSHSAGVIRDGQDRGFWSHEGDFPDEKTLKAIVLESDLILTPNTRLKYSNIGYGLLGQIIEEAGNASYDEYMVAHIIDPLKLTCTSSEYIDGSKLATGYSRRNLNRERFAFPAISTNALAPATGFCSTPSDLCTFFDALKVGSGMLLSDTSKREMQRQQWKVPKESEGYALGLEVVKSEGHQLIGHTGGFPGFKSRTRHDVESDVVVSAVATDTTVTGPIVSSIFKILSEFGDESPSVELLKYEGRFTTLHGAVQIVAHAGGLRRIYPNGWWPLGEVDKLEKIDDASFRIHDVNGFADEGEVIKFEFDAAGKIKSINESGLILHPSDDDDLVLWW